MGFVILTLIAVYNIFNTVATEAGDCESLRIFPPTPYFLETQDIVLECISRKPSPRLTFFWSSKEGPVQEKFITFRNETFIQMVIPSVTAKDVRDYRKGKAISCRDGDQCLYNEYIQLEYYPVEPQNISCLVDNFDTLLCNWSLGVEYKNPHNVKVNSHYVWTVSTQFKINRINYSDWQSCPDATRTSCFWNRNHYNNALWLFLNITVTNTKKNVTCWKTVDIYRDEVLKPGKVKKFVVSDTSEPTCAKLTWESPKLFRNFSYTISYKSECESFKKVVQVACGKDERLCWKQICGLVPFTEYTFEILSRYSPEWQEKGYPSDPVITTFKTAKAKPLKIPLTTSGLYLYDHNHLTVFWQPLSNCDRYSDDTQYEISFENITRNYPSSAYLMDTRLYQANKAYKQFIVMILTKNSEGNATDVIRMEVFPEDEGPKDSELIIEYKGNETECKHYLATIKEDPANYRDFSDIIHTITWCRVSAGACKKPMYWLEDQPAAANISLPIQDCNETYKFGLITKAYSKSHKRMLWTDINTVNCEYRYNMVPKEPLPNIHLSKVMLPNTVTVEWEPYPCVEPTGYIQNFIVTYCEALPPETNETCDCVQKRQDVTVSNQQSSHTIKDLNTGLDICIWVSANSTVGQGPKNRHVLFATVAGGEPPIVTIIIISTCFILVLLGLFLGHRLMEWYKQWKNDRMVPNIDLDLPSINGGQENILVQPQYPIYSEPEEYEREPLMEIYDSQSESSIASEDGLNGYTRPMDIPFNSGDSINSQLSQFDGNVNIRGHTIQLPGADNRNASIKDLTFSDPYISQDFMNKLVENEQDFRLSQNDTQPLGQNDGSMKDKGAPNTKVNEDNFGSRSVLKDDSIKDQTASKMVPYEKDMESINGEDDESVVNTKLFAEDTQSVNGQNDDSIMDQRDPKTMLYEGNIRSINGAGEKSVEIQIVPNIVSYKKDIGCINGKDDGSMEEQPVMKTKLYVDDIQSIDESNDDTMEYQTVPNAKKNKTDVVSKNGQDDDSIESHTVPDTLLSNEYYLFINGQSKECMEDQTEPHTMLYEKDIEFFNGQDDELMEDQTEPQTKLHDVDILSNDGKDGDFIENQTVLKTELHEDDIMPFNGQNGDSEESQTVPITKKNEKDVGSKNGSGDSSMENQTVPKKSYEGYIRLINVLDDNSTENQTALKTEVYKKDIRFINGQDDESMKDQTVLNTKIYRGTSRTENDAENGSHHCDSDRFSNHLDRNGNKSTQCSDFSVQNCSITTVSTDENKSRGSSPGSILSSLTLDENPDPSKSTKTARTSETSTVSQTSTARIDSNGTDFSTMGYVIVTQLAESARIDTTAKTKDEPAFTEDSQSNTHQTSNADDTGIPPSDLSALPEDKRKNAIN